jgi:hypothetical protein
VVLDIAGAPIRLSGRTRLVPVGPDSSTVSYDGDLRSTLPLFRSAIENAAAGAVRAALEVEQDVARRWIADHA